MKGKGKFVLHQIPNTPEGQQLVAGIRKYLNRAEYDINVRGNGPRTAPALAAGRGPKGYDQSLPLAKSTHFRVYIEPKHAPQRETFDVHAHDLATLRAAKIDLLDRIDKLTKTSLQRWELLQVATNTVKAQRTTIDAIARSSVRLAQYNMTLRDRMFADQQHLMAIPKWIRRFFQPAPERN